MARRDLRLPAAALPRHARRVAVDRTELDRHAIFVRLAPVERRALNRHGAVGRAERDDAVRDVRGVEMVMAERRRRIGLGGRAVHERLRPERRRVHGPAGRDEPPRRRHRPFESPARADDEIVGMLIVDERRAVVRLAGLEDLRGSVLMKRPRLGAEHRVQHEPAAAGAPPGGGHEPVLRLDAVDVVELPVLQVQIEEGLPGGRPCPSGRHRRHVVLHLRERRARDERAGGRGDQHERGLHTPER